MIDQDKKVRPFALLALAASAVGAGAFVGATTNAINGIVSPRYFQYVMHWGEIEHAWRAVLAQGIFEGLIYGVLFSIVFTLVVGIVSRGRSTYPEAMRYLLAIVGGTYFCWIVGGLVGMGLAWLSPEFYQRTFYRVPVQNGELFRYAWVGGSIWGALAGSVLACVIGSVLYAVRWRRNK
jgi:hypothetical protein